MLFLLPPDDTCFLSHRNRWWLRSHLGKTSSICSLSAHNMGAPIIGLVSSCLVVSVRLVTSG